MYAIFGRGRFFSLQGGVTKELPNSFAVIAGPDGSIVVIGRT